MGFRFDAVKLGKREKTPEGYLRCDAVIQRCGVFTYRNPDGSTRRELRPPEEVFHADSLASASGKPITQGHPGIVTSKSVRALRIGGPISDARADGEGVTMRLQLEDEAVVEGAERGDLRDLSLGYRVDEDHTPGVHPKYGAYDLVQRNIRVNHIALLPPGGGRQGTEVSLRLDAAEQAELADARVIVLDTNDTSCNTPSVIQGAPSVPDPFEEKRIMRIGALEIKLDAKDEQIIEAHISTVTAERDAAKAAAGKLEAERDVLKARADAQDLVNAKAARAQLETDACKVLGEVKFDGKTDEQVRGEVVAKVFPGIKLDGKDGSYVLGLFEAALAHEPAIEVREDAAAVARALLGAPASAKSPRAEYLERQAKRGQPTK